MGGSISLVHTSPQIGGAFVTLMPMMAVIANALSYGLRNLRRSAAESAGTANALLAESIGNVRVIHSFTAEEYSKQRYAVCALMSSRSAGHQRRNRIRGNTGTMGPSFFLCVNQIP